MTQSDTLLAALKSRAAYINAVMEEDLRSIESPLLAEIIRHAIFQGGKRIRPLLCLQAAALTGPAPADTARLAISFEYLHAASLLHDDIIDHAELRRGKPTANILWGQGPVILAGDYLHARAMTLACDTGGRQIMTAIGRATAAMVEAEFLQIRVAEESLLSETGYFKILAGKTAALIAAACETGILHNKGTSGQGAALRQYGTNLGLAFQIIDDLLDYLGNPETTGKAVGNDFQEGKMTLPLLRALAQAPEPEREFLTRLLAAGPEERGSQQEAARAIIEKNHGFEDARHKAEDLIREACLCLDLFPESEAKALLLGLASHVLARNN